MKKKEPISTIMTKTIHAVQIDDKLTDALELVRKYGVRHVPVVHGKQLVGIISKTDLNRLTFSNMFGITFIFWGVTVIKRIIFQV